MIAISIKAGKASKTSMAVPILGTQPRMLRSNCFRTFSCQSESGFVAKVMNAYVFLLMAGIFGLAEIIHADSSQSGHDKKDQTSLRSGARLLIARFPISRFVPFYP